MENENSSTYQWEAYSTGFARKILEKYGYQGHGLGKNEQGRTSPILPKIRKQRFFFFFFFFFEYLIIYFFKKKTWITFSGRDL
jgi:hypothetical protein